MLGNQQPSAIQNHLSSPSLPNQLTTNSNQRSMGVTSTVGGPIDNGITASGMQHVPSSSQQALLQQLGVASTSSPTTTSASMGQSPCLPMRPVGQKNGPASKDMSVSLYTRK